MKEPILSREQVLKIVRKTLKENGDRDKLSSDRFVALAAAFEEALLEKLCGEPAAWMVLECVHLKPCSVTLDREDVEGHRPEHVISLYALNRSKA